jgi:cytochrome c-type biogenesis protein CcmE
MAHKKLQFGAAIAVVLMTLTWLAVSGVQESRTYYVTIKELQGMGDDAYSKRLRVAGNVAPGTIKRQGRRVEFVLLEEGRTMPVVYTGTQPLPDTFVDNSQALADGRYTREGVFEASQIQAKCASKYEAKPGEQPQQPSYSKPASEGPKKSST